MRMIRPIASARPLIFGAIVALAACADAASGETPAADTADLTSKPLASYVDWHDAHTVSQVQFAGGNAGHYVGLFDTGRYAPPLAMKDLRANDGRRGCTGRTYSTSKDDGVRIYDEFVQAQNPYGDGSPTPTQAAIAHNRHVRELLTSPDTLGVYASVYDRNGVDANNSEGCLYFTFDVYRANGTTIRFNFDYTD